MKKNELICLDDAAPKNIKPDDLPYIFVTKFDDAAVIDFYKQFLIMNSNDKVKVIPVIISSFGGQVHSLLPMIDIIESSTKPVSTIALGKAMSCGAILLASGTKGHRYIAPSTDVMIHEVSSMEWGKTTDIQNGSKQTKTLNDFLFRHLANKAGMKNKDYFLQQLKERGNVDWYLTATEYKKLGLADHISVPKLVRK